MTDQTTTTRTPSRLKRLLQLLAVAALLWAVVALVRFLLPSSTLSQARAAVAGGKFEEAARLYEQHLSARPADWEVRTELGLVLAEFDRPRALGEFRQVPPEADAYLEARRQMVWICLASERLNEAEAVLLELNEKVTDDFLPPFQLAQLYFRQRRAAAALPYAKRSTELNPEHAPGHFLVAELLDDLGRTSEMIVPLERVIELELDHYAAHLDLAYAYAESGEPAKSRREAAWCLERHPQDVNARRFLAQAARDEGKIEEAMREIDAALRIVPADVECRLLEAELLLFQEQPEKALKRLQPLYEHHASDRRLVALLARAAASSGNAAEAARYRQQVQRLSE